MKEMKPSNKKNTNVWNVLIQVMIAVLTALTGVFAGCQIAK